MASRAEPRVGCGALILREGKVLLVLRRRPPEAGCWGIPGGKVDWMEPVPDALDREIAEEIGVRVTAKRLLAVVDHLTPEEDQHWVAPAYLVDAFEGEPRLLEPDALGGMDWFPLDALPDRLTKPTRVALAALRP